MIQQVKKRDGRMVDFNPQKIEDAISRAGFVTDDVKHKIATDIQSMEQPEITVEDIQDLVEKALMASDYKDVAKEYVRYRYRRELIRENERLNNSILEIVAGTNEYINGENSNKNPIIASTQRDYIISMTQIILLRKSITVALSIWRICFRMVQLSVILWLRDRILSQLLATLLPRLWLRLLLISMVGSRRHFLI